MEVETKKQFQASLERWKQNLIDLSFRNRLLNFKPGSKSVVKLLEPELDGLYELLVEKEKGLELFPLPEESPAEGSP